MIHWNSKIYMDEKVQKKPAKYRRMVEKRRFVNSCYIITLPMNMQNCADIYSSRELWFQYYRRKHIEIIGLAADQNGAEEILCRMMQDIYQENGQVDAQSVKNYFHS